MVINSAAAAYFQGVGIEFIHRTVLLREGLGHEDVGHIAIMIRELSLFARLC